MCKTAAEVDGWHWCNQFGRPLNTALQLFAIRRLQIAGCLSGRKEESAAIVVRQAAFLSGDAPTARDTTVSVVLTNMQSTSYQDCAVYTEATALRVGVRLRLS